MLFYNPDIDGFETGPSLDATNGRTEGACTLFYSPLHENRPVVLAVGGQSNPTPQLLDYSTENALHNQDKPAVQCSAHRHKTEVAFVSKQIPIS